VANDLVSINSERTLTPEQHCDLADVPPELEWLANITNAKTRRAYKVDVAEFFSFTNLKDPNALRMGDARAWGCLAQGHGSPEPCSDLGPPQAFGPLFAL
jgi:hypothetical protein